MRFNNAISGCVLVLFALAAVAYATTFPRLHGQNYGPDLFPTLIGISLFACGIILIVQGIAHRTTVPMIKIGDWVEDRRNITNIGILLGCMIGYILVSGWLGFIPSSLVILTTLLVRFGSTWRASLIIAVVTTFALHTLFAKLLLVPLPWGILLPVAW